MLDRSLTENYRGDYMSYQSIQERHMHDYVVEQLATYGYTDVNGKTKDELTRILAKHRAMEIEPNAPGNDWF